MTTVDNPWVTRSDDGNDDVADPFPTAPPLTGPRTPQAGVRPPRPESCLPVMAGSSHGGADLWVVGAHGGAGESSIAALIPGARPAGHAWPADPAASVLVARTGASALLRAQAALVQWASGEVPDVDLLGLVLIADAPGRLPRPLRSLARHVSGGAPRTWTVPWIDSWRMGEPPVLSTAPRIVRRLVGDLDLLLDHRADPAAGHY